MSLIVLLYRLTRMCDTCDVCDFFSLFFVFVILPQDLLLKACVRYFLSNFFSTIDSPSKTVKNVFYFI